MADVATYTFDLKEATIALIKQQGLHEGVWFIGVEFNLGAGMTGQGPDDIKPSAILQINRLQLARVPPDSPTFAVGVDASEVNPIGSSKGHKERKPKRSSTVESL